MADDANEFAGTMLFGADGAVYLVPDDALSEYRVDDKNAERFRDARAELVDEVTGFGMPGSSPILEFPLAIGGTFGRRISNQGEVVIYHEGTAIKDK